MPLKPTVKLSLNSEMQYNSHLVLSYGAAAKSTFFSKIYHKVLIACIKSLIKLKIA